jgi:hypothetical protein
MRLSAVPIVNFSNINNFSYSNQWAIRAKEPNTLYFQIVDLDQGPANVIGTLVYGWTVSSTLAGNVGLRYMVGVGAPNQPSNVIATFPSINEHQVIQSVAIQDSDDKSIWKVSLSSGQTPNSGDVIFSITEGNVTRRFSVLEMLSVEHPQDDGEC